MKLEALVLTPEDNVATAVCSLGNSDKISIGDVDVVTLLQDIPFGHKIALLDIAPGDKIIKYGEVMGQATVSIKRGEHVHIHNVEGLRGRGDKR